MSTALLPRVPACAQCLCLALCATLAAGCLDAIAPEMPEETLDLHPPLPPPPTPPALDEPPDDPQASEPQAPMDAVMPPPVLFPPGGFAGTAGGWSGTAGAPAAADGGVGWGPVPSGFTESEVALYSTLSPLPGVPPDTTNAVADDPKAAELGRALFEDPLFAGPLVVDSELGAVGDTGQVSCATCHFGPSLADPAPVSTGTGVGTRNSISLTNSAFQRWTNWGGRFSAQWELAIPVVENPAVMNGSRLRVAHRIFDGHRELYESVFGPLPEELDDYARFPEDGKPKPAPTTLLPDPPDGAWEGMSDDDRAIVNGILVNYGKAIEAFLRTLVSRDAPFDAFVAGDTAALDAFAQAGLRLFVGKARCITCHNGPLFSDGAFHDIGAPQRDPMLPVDDGRYKDIPALLASPFNSASAWSDDPDSGRLAGLTNPPPEDTRGQFRTPSLRGVALSAPYMHDGVFPDLRAVVEHYNWGGGEPASGVRDRQLVALHLTDEEIEQLIAFLQSLTGAPPDGSLTSDVRPTW